MATGQRGIHAGPDIDYDLNTLVKAIVAAKLLSADREVSDKSLLIAVVSMSSVVSDTRKKIYSAATKCQSTVVHAIPRSDICKLATLPNSLMGLGEINATDMQNVMLGIVAKPYDNLVRIIGSGQLEQTYFEVKPMMTRYFNRFCTGAFQENMSGEMMLEKAGDEEFAQFCKWWEEEVKRRIASPRMGTVKVKTSKSWGAEDVIDCFALGVLAGSARLPQYLPIQINLALMLGLETKILNPTLAPCEWYKAKEQREEYRVDCHTAGLTDIDGDAIVREAVPKETYQQLQSDIKERTNSVSEDSVLVTWRRPIPIAVVLFLAASIMVLQIIFDRVPDDNACSVVTRAVTNFVGISVVVITLIIRLFYNDWSLHDMWQGQRRVKDVGQMARQLDWTFGDVVLALRNSEIWNRALSDTNACLILRDGKNAGGVVMKNGLSLDELLCREYLLSHSSSTIVIPRSDGTLDIYMRSKGSVFLYLRHSKWAVMTCFGSLEGSLQEYTVG